eukprot:CAMPEP_0172500944 /NCGR_PEP_ID=MMETSP1066-20121228/144395_1 /TAXON_ID=671091 /ORGANISM="Coscinodiscus wailesii, Strain CCMP2513" /LENGTH=281 /DNA_ID=CAMNT_0013275453 /DNA_START=15 /DNA_END=860 /DNA_ORIENTATION=+
MPRRNRNTNKAKKMKVGSGDYKATTARNTIHDMNNILARLFLQHSWCVSEEEATIIADEVLSATFSDTNPTKHMVDGAHVKLEGDRLKSFVLALQDFFGEHQASVDQAGELARQLSKNDNDCEPSDSSDSVDSKVGKLSDIESQDIDHYRVESDDDYIAEGECELCERYMKLTKHHLLPKSTWTKMKKLLHAAADDKSKLRLVEYDFDDLPAVLDNFSIRAFISKTCDICRPCHTRVHQVHDHMTLATRFNTVEKLIHDEDILKFCKWAHKQRPGKYAISY